MNSLPRAAEPELNLRAQTAADLMTPNPVSVRANAPLADAIALLADKGYSAAPVINAAGLPVGVLSRSDILIHDRETVCEAVQAPEYFEHADLPSGDRWPKDDRVAVMEEMQVRDLMTPVLFSVSPSTPAAQVVRDMLALRVHRLFVVDDDGVLVGVISPLDVLRRLE